MLLQPNASESGGVDALRAAADGGMVTVAKLAQFKNAELPMELTLGVSSFEVGKRHAGQESRNPENAWSPMV